MQSVWHHIFSITQEESFWLVVSFLCFLAILKKFVLGKITDKLVQDQQSMLDSFNSLRSNILQLEQDIAAQQQQIMELKQQKDEKIETVVQDLKLQHEKFLEEFRSKMEQRFHEQSNKFSEDFLQSQKDIFIGYIRNLFKQVGELSFKTKSDSIVKLIAKIK